MDSEWTTLATQLRDFAYQRWGDGMLSVSLCLLHRGTVTLPLPPLQERKLGMGEIAIPVGEESARPYLVPGGGAVYWPALGRFTFCRKSQRRVIAYLWRALELGCAEVPEKRLLREARTDCLELARVFRGHRAWGTLIQPGRVPRNYRLPELN